MKIADVCLWYPVEDAPGGDRRYPRVRVGRVCLAPAPADDGTRCAAHAGLGTGADRYPDEHDEES